MKRTYDETNESKVYSECINSCTEGIRGSISRICETLGIENIGSMGNMWKVIRKDKDVVVGDKMDYIIGEMLSLMHIRSNPDKYFSNPMYGANVEGAKEALVIMEKFAHIEYCTTKGIY